VALGSAVGRSRSPGGPSTWRLGSSPAWAHTAWRRPASCPCSPLCPQRTRSHTCTTNTHTHTHTHTNTHTHTQKHINPRPIDNLDCTQTHLLIHSHKNSLSH